MCAFPVLDDLAVFRLYFFTAVLLPLLLVSTLKGQIANYLFIHFLIAPRT